ncbi:two-component system sensor histidine kinase NtrB [Roseovarius nanhaiticus]|uniref:two-component system sensor histidine kinase NtrB n=1 Tax=Roseovarius nanhaiticus TaxID=573024 RepID=UPI002490A791|nr:ATP-binding protein [Roseovarius nanhaiticus]
MSRDHDALWTALPVPALLLDDKDCTRQANPAAETFLNASERALVGQPIWPLLDMDAPIAPALARARAAGGPLFIGDVSVSARGHPRMQCSVQIAPYSADADQELMLMLITPREFSGQMTHDPRARPAERAAIGMAEMLSHEIKNPLAGITGAAQLLSMNLGPDDCELTDLIVSESRRIAALLHRVESYGNIPPPRFASLNVHDVLRRARQSASLGLAADMRIVEAYDPSLPEAWADADMLLQVLQNLIKNAAEAAGAEGGTITLRSAFEQGARQRGADGWTAPLPLQIEVIDDGPGVPPDLATSLFEPFVSGRENGTGLGLALAARIMAAHGGWIGATSRPGRTVFRLSLPLAAHKEETV